MAGGRAAISLAPGGGEGRREWGRIFRRLVEILRSQQSQIESLAGDREFLDRFVQIQHERWLSLVRLLESRVQQMGKEKRKERRFQAAKAELLLGAKEREALCYKKQSELAENDLEDFRTCMIVLTTQITELKEKLKEAETHAEPIENIKDEGHSGTALRGELRKLKQAYKTLSSKRDTEVSALLAEKDFVWNQFKKMENDYTVLLKGKRLEAAQASEAAEKLQHSVDELRMLTQEKDETIERLRAERSQLESDMRKHTQEAADAKEKISVLEHQVEELWSLARKKDGEIQKLKDDIDKLEKDASKSSNRKSRFTEDPASREKSRNSRGTPVGSRTRSSGRHGLTAKQAGSRSKKGSGKQNVENAEGDTSQKRKRVSRDSIGTQASSSINGLRRCSGRLQRKTMSPVVSPVLFSSSFKVPKLKTPPEGLP